MNEFYELGVAAAIEELEKRASTDAVAAKVAGVIPEALKTSVKGLYGKSKDFVGKSYGKSKDFAEKSYGKVKDLAKAEKDMASKALSRSEKNIKLNPSKSHAEQLAEAKKETWGARKTLGKHLGVGALGAGAIYGTKKALE